MTKNQVPRNGSTMNRNRMKKGLIQSTTQIIISITFLIVGFETIYASSGKLLYEITGPNSDSVTIIEPEESSSTGGNGDYFFHPNDVQVDWAISAQVKKLDERMVKAQKQWEKIYDFYDFRLRDEYRKDSELDARMKFIREVKKIAGIYGLSEAGLSAKLVANSEDTRSVRAKNFLVEIIKAMSMALDSVSNILDSIHNADKKEQEENTKEIRNEERRIDYEENQGGTVAPIMDDVCTFEKECFVTQVCYKKKGSEVIDCFDKVKTCTTSGIKC